MTGLHKSITRLERWFVDSALPLWAASGYDNVRGGFYETLDFQGRPIVGQPRRVRVQARQIHTFSQAGIRGWHEDAEALAAKGFDYFLEHACTDNGNRGCVHTLSDDGEILDTKRDLYDQAFLLLACASRWEVSKDGRAIELADKTLAFMDTELASPHGGWLESDQKELPRRQNPHMHLFEAFMALYRVTGGNKYFDYAQSIINDCFSSFIDHGEGVLREYFSESLAKDEARKQIEPGHMFEWVWLLSAYEKIADADFSDERLVLFGRAEHFGIDPHFFGFIGNTTDMTAPNQRSSKRLWPQTEYLRACCVRAREGDVSAEDKISALIDANFETYLNVETNGLWIDEFDAHGAPIASDVPASILYHLFEAVAETVDFKGVRDK